MQITVELSLYPLGSTNPVAEIVEFIAAIREDAHVSVVVNQMSTQMTGELEEVMRVLTEAMQRSFGPGGKQVVVAKFLNSSLPILESPVLVAE